MAKALLLQEMGLDPIRDETGRMRVYAITTTGDMPEEMLRTATISELEYSNGCVYRDHYLSEFPPGSKVYILAVEMIIAQFEAHP